MTTATAQFLKEVGLFSLLTEEEVQSLMEFLRLIEIGEGEMLFREGDAGHELYIVKSGRIRVAISLPDGREKDITEFMPGDFFGEMSIFENAPRSASCYASADSTLYSLRGSDFFRLMRDWPSVAIRIMYRMSNITTRRLRSTGEFLSDMVLWGERARKRAITDELTGVYNRHFLEEALENQFRRAGESGSPLSVVMVDLDHFRSINEEYGHEVGDEILVSAVRVFRSHLREGDIAARYGGDEFVFLMPHTSLDQARRIAQRICRELRSLQISRQDFGEGSVRVTTSQGVASYPDHGHDVSAVMKRADSALYRAKELGRNRVICAGESG
jgi:diguanylate cyclase (GGDEF)-like protein